jgi:hypothetical protein
MTFLIAYDRSTRRTSFYKTYGDDEENEARDQRLSLELEARRVGRDVEIVVLQAQSEEALRKTHARYFETVAGKLTLDELKNDVSAALAKASRSDAA